ncbi:MAG: arginase family protein [Candidatus Heimdallarchaeota archaeon]
MDICLIAVPYHLGQEKQGMGLGPLKYLEAGIEQELITKVGKTSVEIVYISELEGNEKSRIVQVNQDLRRRVARARTKAQFPLILGGNCNTCFGTLAGLNTQDVGIVYLDAHGDFNTPETTLTGFFDGMPLAVATGQCHRDLWDQIADIDPIAESQTVHLGGRDFDPPEKKLLDNSHVMVVNTADIKDKGIENALLPVLKKLQKRVSEIYLHIDIDVIDPTEVPGVDYRTPDGLSSDDVLQIIQILNNRFSISAAALTAYNPEKDIGETTVTVGKQLIHRLAKLK